MTNFPGGEFAGAWEAIAAATPRKRGKAFGGAAEWRQFTTEEMVRDIGSDQIDPERRIRMQAEIDRRIAKQRRR